MYTKYSCLPTSTAPSLPYTDFFLTNRIPVLFTFTCPLSQAMMENILLVMDIQMGHVILFWSMREEDRSSQTLLSNIFVSFKRRLYKGVVHFLCSRYCHAHEYHLNNCSRPAKKVRPRLRGKWSLRMTVAGRGARKLYPWWCKCATESTNPAACPTSHTS